MYIYNIPIVRWFHSPLTSWWNAKKYFRFPDINVHIVKRCIKDYMIPWYIFLFVSDVVWKSKYGEARHEDNPMIVLNFFGLFKIVFEFGRWINKKDYSMEYWEALLNYSKCNQSLLESLRNSIWKDSKGNKTPICDVCLWKH